MGRLAGKIALVTGAGSGIGRACAEALAAEGAKVAVSDIDRKGGAETTAAIKNAGGEAIFQHHDVSDEESWKTMLAAVKGAFGALHVLVNNAGICVAAPLAEMTTETWRRQLAINLDSMFFGAKHAMPLLVEAGGGSIVNLSSVAGLKGVPGLSGYCASKGGVRLFTKAVALECAQAHNNVRVNSVHPGAIETPIWVKMGYNGDLPPPDAVKFSNAMEMARAASVAATPVGHAGVPTDIAQGVVFLASDESRFITGTELIIDGGVMAG
ncbi:MAG TPA: glucose 1-dehydrogenase [Rhizomicrobium sp.]|jgi:NAD(P)-dependent dehydrogenase (short-subunit alcohol dehydrogenase family)